MSNCSLDLPLPLLRQSRNDSFQLSGTEPEKVHPRPELLPIPLPAGYYSSNVVAREKLYAEFAPLVRRLIRQYGQDSEMRKDLAGEIYCRFCNLLDCYMPERGVPLRPYLVRQLSTGVYAYARQQWRLQRRESRWDTQDGVAEYALASDPTPNWLASLSQQQIIETLPEALSRLPARQRKVVIWRYYEERSFEDIAQVLGVQTATARSLLRHGLNNLRRQMRPEVTVSD